MAALAFPSIPTQIVPKCSITGAGGKLDNPCTVCDLFQLLQNIFNFIWVISIPLAVLLLAYGGLLMVVPFSGESTEMYKKGGKVIKNALLGLVLVTFSWLIIDTIIKVVAGQEIGNREPAKIFGPWNTIECTKTTFSLAPTGAAAAAPALNPLCFKDNFYICSSEAKALIQEGKSWSENDGSNVRTSKGGVNCTKYNGALTSYNQYIQLAAQRYGISPERIEALILVESSGINQKPRVDRNKEITVGLMQVQVPTARNLIGVPNMPDLEVIRRLNDPQTNINLGTRNFANLVRSYNGSYSLATAAHNGGPDANGASRDCPGSTKWQCPWDSGGCYGTGNTNCRVNTGYAVTRQFVPTVDALETAIKSGSCQPIK